MLENNTKCSQCGNNGYYYVQKNWNEQHEFVFCDKCKRTRLATKLLDHLEFILKNKKNHTLHSIEGQGCRDCSEVQYISRLISTKGESSP